MQRDCLEQNVFQERQSRIFRSLWNGRARTGESSNTPTKAATDFRRRKNAQSVNERASYIHLLLQEDPVSDLPSARTGKELNPCRWAKER